MYIVKIIELSLMTSGIYIHLRKIISILGLYRCLLLISSSIFMVFACFQSLICLEFILVKNGRYTSNLFFFLLVTQLSLYHSSNKPPFFPPIDLKCHFYYILNSSSHLCPLKDFLFCSINLLFISALVPIIWCYSMFQDLLNLVLSYLFIYLFSDYFWNA